MTTPALSITDGTNTVSLSTSGVILTEYIPVASGGVEYEPLRYETVTESCRIVLNGGSEATNAATITTLGQLFERARRRQRINAGVRVYVQLQMSSDASVWRSELLDGRIEPQHETMDMWSTKTPPLTISWERQGFWEGERTALTMTSSVTSPGTTNEVTLYSNDDGTPTQTNWVRIADVYITGSLPAPLEIHLKMAASGMTQPRAMISNLVFVGPEELDPFEYGSQAENGAQGDWTGSGITDLVWIWELLEDDVAVMGGHLMRIIVVFTGSVSGIDVRPVVYAYASGSYQTLYVGQWTRVNGQYVDLAAVPIPPGGYDATGGDVALGLSVRHTATGNATIDFIQMTPAGDGLYRVLEQVGFQTAANDKFVDDPVNGIAYIQESGSNNHQPIVYPRYMPLHVWPSRDNELRVLLAELNNFTPGRQLTMQAWYRPRRAVL